MLPTSAGTARRNRSRPEIPRFAPAATVTTLLGNHVDVWRRLLLPRFGDEAGIGDAARACPVGDVPSRPAGAGLVSAFVEVEHRDSWIGQRSDLGIAQRRQMAVIAL